MCSHYTTLGFVCCFCYLGIQVPAHTHHLIWTHTHTHKKLELTKHITPHANDAPLLKRSSSHSPLSQFCNDCTCCLVCQQRRSVPGKFQSQVTKRRYLPMELWDIIIQTNRARCALNMKILDLLNKETISGACRSTIPIFFLSTTYCIYVYVCVDTSPDHVTPCSCMHVQGKTTGYWSMTRNLSGNKRKVLN